MHSSKNRRKMSPGLLWLAALLCLSPLQNLQAVSYSKINLMDDFYCTPGSASHTFILDSYMQTQKWTLTFWLKIPPSSASGSLPIVGFYDNYTIAWLYFFVTRNPTTGAYTLKMDSSTFLTFGPSSSAVAATTHALDHANAGDWVFVTGAADSSLNCIFILVNMVSMGSFPLARSSKYIEVYLGASTAGGTCALSFRLHKVALYFGCFNTPATGGNDLKYLASTGPGDLLAIYKFNRNPYARLIQNILNPAYYPITVDQSTRNYFGLTMPAPVGFDRFTFTNRFSMLGFSTGLYSNSPVDRSYYFTMSFTIYATPQYMADYFGGGVGGRANYGFVFYQRTQTGTATFQSISMAATIYPAANNMHVKLTTDNVSRIDKTIPAKSLASSSSQPVYFDLNFVSIAVKDNLMDSTVSATFNTPQFTSSPTSTYTIATALDDRDYHSFGTTANINTYDFMILIGEVTFVNGFLLVFRCEQHFEDRQHLQSDDDRRPPTS